MIKIYSADPETGALYTDAKQHFYIDGEMLRERKLAVRTNYLLDKVAQAIGYRDFSALDTYLRCSGITADVRDAWILSGTLVENLVR